MPLFKSLVFALLYPTRLPNFALLLTVHHKQQIDMMFSINVVLVDCMRFATAGAIHNNSWVCQSIF